MNKLHFFAVVIICLVIAGCGENNILLDDPNVLDPDIPQLDVADHDYVQSHLRSYEKNGYKMKLKDDVKFLTPYQLRHLKAVNELHTVLTFDGELSYLPKNGDKIIYSPYTIGEVNMILPGCMGKVVEVKPSSRESSSFDVCLEEEGIEGLDDYFDEFEIENAPIIFRQVRADDQVEKSYYLKIFSNDGSLASNPLKVDLELIKVLDIGFDINGHFEFGIQGTFSGSKKRKFYDLSIKPMLSIDADFGLHTKIELLGFNNARLDILDVPAVTLASIPEPPLVFTLNIRTALYPIAEGNAKVAGHMKINQALSEVHLMANHNRFSSTLDLPTIQNLADWTVFEKFSDFMAEGKVGVGIRIYPTFSCNGIKLLDADYVYIDGNIGLSMNKNIRFDQPNELDLTHTPIKLGVEASLNAKLEHNIFDNVVIKAERKLLSLEATIKELYLPPTYTGWRHTDDVGNKTTVLSAIPTGDLLLPVRTGYALYTGVDPKTIDSRTNIMATQWAPETEYPSWVQKLVGTDIPKINATFTGLNEGQTYTAIPYIGFFGEVFAMPVFGDNYYSFTFGEKSPSPVRRLKSIVSSYNGLYDKKVTITFDYDSKGRLVEFVNPLGYNLIKIDYENNNITSYEYDPDDDYMSSDPDMMNNIEFDTNGYITSCYTEGDMASYKTTYTYTNGYITKISSAVGECDFEWKNGKLLSIHSVSSEMGEYRIDHFEYEYEKNAKPNEVEQIWYVDNPYFYLFYSGLLGKKPCYLPSKCVYKLISNEGDGYNETSTHNVSFEIDNDGYINSETTQMYGIDISLNYNYE